MFILFKLELFKLRKKLRAWLGPILVFLLITISFPLTVELASDDLKNVFYSVLWIASLLTVMVSVEGIFLEDYEDGTLENFSVSNDSLFAMVFMKIFIYWLLIGVPISLLGTFFSISMSGQISSINIALPSMLISTYIFINLFSLGNSLSLNKGSVLGALITMPLLFPILILLGKIVLNAGFGFEISNLLLLMLGVLLLIIVCIPFIISFIIRTHLE
ncbi:MAG: heme exporter protein CcmB [SAR86 cluster bacterium]|jgi:heme exporter protein B|uniref:Heme exporter protein CcmB n=1 Tax=SAR86 cluster bacterium TaxID=2030880 RepID=A0A937M1W3_9GAMM|nr:heme exporter protein CcmB [SAR86 cluster bacterium]|tara:strand:+ start:535 stop:1185 length:651 start_codon:yes stop_codon:yes gene_type:complete